MMFQLLKLVYAAESEEAIIPDYPREFKYSLFGSNIELGKVISDALQYVYVIAGLVLLIILISGGIGLMTSAGNPDKIKAGYGKITSALIGFFIVFISYIVVMLVQTIFGVDIGFTGGNGLF